MPFGAEIKKIAYLIFEGEVFGVKKVGKLFSWVLTFAIVATMFSVCGVMASAQDIPENAGTLYFRNTLGWEQVGAYTADGALVTAKVKDGVYSAQLTSGNADVYFSNGANERTKNITGYKDGQIFLPDADDKATESGVTTYGGTLDYYKVKNVILMIGDGMGAEQAKAGEIYKGSKLVMQTLPYSTMVTTYSNDGVTDSSAAATAMATGYKTNNNMVGMVADGTKKENLVEFSKARGLKTGVIVTQVLPHATPAGFTAHVSARYSYNSIAAQQLLLQADVLFGGGGSYFDNREEAIEANNYVRVNDLASVASVDPSKNILGTFHTSYITADDQPRLAKTTKAGLDRLTNDNGFFAMIEGSDIDSYAHKNEMDKMLKEMIVFDEAIDVANNYVKEHPDTLLLVTADHETGGLKVPDGATASDLTDALFSTGNHTGADVPLYAAGARAWDFCSSDKVDNTFIHDFIADVLNESYGEAPEKDFTDYEARKVFFELPESWETPYAYTAGAVSVGEFPGVEMEHVDGNVYSVTLRDYAGEMTKPGGQYVAGDLNGDGKSTVADILEIQKYAAKKINLTDDQLLAADLNEDGMANIKDVLEIQKYLAGFGNPYNIGAALDKPAVPVDPLSIVFSNGGDCKTIEIPFKGFNQKYIITDGESTDSATGRWEEYHTTAGVIYFEKPESWKNAYFYTWGDAYFGVWPGTKMQQVKDNIYSITVSDSEILETTLEFNLIFSSGTTYQTMDLEFAGFNKIYKIVGGENTQKAYGTWSDYDPDGPEKPTEPGNPMKIYLQDQTSWDITTDGALLYVQCDGGEKVPLDYLGSRTWSAIIPGNYSSIIFLRVNPKDATQVWNAFAPAAARGENDMYCVTGSTTGNWAKFEGAEPDPTGPTDPTEPFDPTKDDSAEFEGVPHKNVYLKDETSWGINTDSPVIFAQCGDKKIIAKADASGKLWTASVPADWDTIVFNRVDPATGKIWNAFPKAAVSIGENNMYVATTSSAGTWQVYTEQPTQPSEPTEPSNPTDPSVPTDPSQPTDPTEPSSQPTEPSDEPFDPTKDDSAEFEGAAQKNVYLKDETSWGIGGAGAVIFAQNGDKKIIAKPDESGKLFTASIPQAWDTVIFNRVDPATGKVWNSFPLEAAVLGENNMYTATGSKTGEWSVYTPDDKPTEPSEPTEPSTPGEEKTVTVYFKDMRGTEYYVPQVKIGSETFDMELLPDRTDLGTLEASADGHGGWYSYTFTASQDSTEVMFLNSSGKYNMTASVSKDSWFTSKRYDYKNNENLVDYTALHNAIAGAQKEEAPSAELAAAIDAALAVYNKTSYSPDKISVSQSDVDNAAKAITDLLS